MFKISFFTKKYFLIDSIQYSLDIHNHFLPGIDDGSSDIETSQDMLYLYKQSGFNGIICTPHIMMGFYNNDSFKIRQNLKDTLIQLESITNFSISAAAEYM